MKQFVDVICLNQKTGQIRPLYILWENGEKYPIDKITQIIPAASLKSGGMGLRFTCKIGNSYRYLFLEEGKWFIEKVQLN
ncbi:MAG TPA: hypothetical protein PLT36_03140 [Erysipelotrichaceae bacterium]|nr:hypothetical protein [Erysipelotrichaceae bacterium]HQA85175.1 hypothetical protein [Erysipelotrichaceae bacterium]